MLSSAPRSSRLHHGWNTGSNIGTTHPRSCEAWSISFSWRSQRAMTTCHADYARSWKRLWKSGFWLTERMGWSVRLAWSLLPVFGYWLFFQKPTRNPALYFGDDSVALACRIRPRHGGSTLDLCAGPGIQSLVASGISGSVTAVEINPAAAEIAKLNVMINRRDDRISVLTGDLYEPLSPDLRYDHVVANPPLLPVPRNMQYPFVGDGGPDGLTVTRRILSGLPTRLHPAGTAQIIGTCLSDGILPFAADEMAEWTRRTDMDLRMTVAAHVPLSPGTPMFQGLVETAGGPDLAESFASFLAARARRVLGNLLSACEVGSGTFHGTRHVQGRTCRTLVRLTWPGQRAPRERAMGEDHHG